MRRGEFISWFLESLASIGEGSLAIFSRESLHYKDLRLAGYDPRKIYKGLRNLKGRAVIRETKPGCFRFTKTGICWLKQKMHRNFQAHYGKWDGKWRVILFDIPQEMSRQRVALRRKLRWLGLSPLQKSVFVFPYPCAEEVGEFASRLEVTDYIDIITAGSLGHREREIRKIFGL